MNIVNKLTIRHLRKNKRRTLVTIIGVIISVAMLTAVSTLAVSFLDLMKREVIANNGEWHVVYHNVNPGQISAIQKDENTKKVALTRNAGFAEFAASQNDRKPYFFIREYSEEAFSVFPIELLEGRLPQAENELVITEEAFGQKGAKLKIGEPLILQVGERKPFDPEYGELDLSSSLLFEEDGEPAEEIVDAKERTYSIVGVIKAPSWEPSWSASYTALGYVDENLVTNDSPANATVVLKNVRSSLFTETEKLAKNNKIEQTDFNYDLLRYSGVIKGGGMRTTLYGLSAIIMTIIIIGSVSLIYNAFAISVSERFRHLGMLSSVGATKQQKRNSVFFEGFVIGTISIPIGIFAGLIGIGITFLCINPIIKDALYTIEGLKVIVTPLSILTAILVSCVTIFISTFLPARKAGKITAIDAIRQTADVKLTGKAVKTSKLVRKLFGIEGEIGLKNLKRNRRRYQATVFSLVISIVLFLSVSNFTDNLKKSLALSQGEANYDILVGLGHEEDEELTRTILGMKEVTDYSLVTEIGLTTFFDKEVVADEIRQYDDFSSQLEDGKYLYYVSLISLDDNSLRKYADDVGVDVAKLTQEPGAIVVETIKYEDAIEGKYVETKALHTKVGEKINLYATDWESEKQTYFDDVTIQALTDKLPMGVESTALGGVNIIVSESTLVRFGDVIKDQIETDPHLYLNSTDPAKTQKKIEEIEENKHYIFNVYQVRKSDEQMILLMSVFTYGFITLITAISIANILNTISTSISLRKREFGMLKSIGMTPKGFNKMINYESVFYGIKSLLYGLPLSILAMYFIHKTLMYSFSYQFQLPWLNILIVMVAVFIIVAIAMLYSSSKVKKENIIDALKQENI